MQVKISNIFSQNVPEELKTRVNLSKNNEIIELTEI